MGHPKVIHKYDYSPGQVFGTYKIIGKPSLEGLFSCACVVCGSTYDVSKKNLVEKKRNDAKNCRNCRPGTNGYMTKETGLPATHGLPEIGMAWLQGKL